MEKKISISLCMIVKDEAKTLCRCLNSVKSFIDEIIIVDTGSKDETKEIASKFNSKIYDFKWINNFAAARNFAFSKATSDYIMWLDGDDYINDENVKKIKLLLENMDKSYDYVSAEYILARNDQGDVTTSLRRNRIVKRACGFIWIGNVHEYLDVYGRGLEGNFSIEHGKIKEYTDRNLKIFRNMEKENKKFTPRDIYYYANELFDNGYYKEAIKQYRRFINTNEGWIEDVKGAYLKIIRALNIIDRKDKIVDIAFESFKLDNPTAEISCSLGNYYLEKNNFKQAAFWYRVAIDSRPDDYNMAISNSDYYTWIPSLQLCVCYYNLGNKKCSYFFNELAASFNGDSEKILYNRELFEKEFKDLNMEVPKLEYPLRLSDYTKYL